MRLEGLLPECPSLELTNTPKATWQHFHVFCHVEEEDKLSTSASPPQNVCRPESRTLRADPWKSLAVTSYFSTASEGFSISIFPASKTFQIL